MLNSFPNPGLQAKGGYSAANYGFDQQEEEEPETESEDEVSLRAPAGRKWRLLCFSEVLSQGTHAWGPTF